MSPKFVDRDQKKKDIALASLPVFSKGFDDANIDQIAKAAGIGKGTVYEYFDSKQEIFQTAVEVWIDQATRTIRTLLRDIENPAEALKTFVETATTMFDPTNSEVLGIFNAIQQQTLSETGIYHNDRYKIRDMCTGGLTIVTDILLDGISKGIFKPEIARDVDIIARNMLSYLDGIGLWSGLMPEGEFDYTTHVNHFFNLYLEMITI